MKSPRSLLAAGALATLAAACSGESATGTPDPGPPSESVVASVDVTSPGDSVFTGRALQLTAVAKTASGQVLTGKAVSWQSSSDAQGRVDAAGLVTGVAEGTVTITATVDGKSGSQVIRVLRVPVAQVAIAAPRDSLAVGDTLRLAATPRDEQGQAIAGRTIQWQSSDPAIVTVDAAGLLQGVGVGTAAVRATVDGRTDSLRVRIVPPPPVARVDLQLRSATLLEGVTTEVASAVPNAADGRVLAGRQVTWSSSDPAIVAIDATGRLTARAPGRAELIATVEGITARRSVLVEDRARFEGECQWCYFDPANNPNQPAWDAAAQGNRPNPLDRREQIVVDESFQVPAGQEVRWENKVVWVRPRARRNIEVAGTLIVRNSLLLWDQQEHQQTRLVVKGGGTLQIDESYAFSANPFWINWDFEDGARIDLDHYQGNPWVSVKGAVTLRAVNGSSATLTLFDDLRDATIDVQDSHNVWLEVIAPPGTHELSFPARHRWTDWTPNALWPNSRVSFRSSYLYDRDITINNNVHVTMRDTPDGFGVGWLMSKLAPGHATCEVSGMGDPAGDPKVGRHYAQASWALACNNSSLTVVNGAVRKIWGYAFGNVHWIVRDSYLADPRVEGPSTLQIYNSTVENVGGYVGGSGAGAKVYLEEVRVIRDLQIRGAGSMMYGYDVRMADSSPLRVFQEAGGQYVTLQTRGLPW